MQVTFSDLPFVWRRAAGHLETLWSLEAVLRNYWRHARPAKAAAQTSLLFSTLLFLVGCGLRPAPVISIKGALPAPSEYRLSDEDIAAESIWRDRLVERLAVRGFRQGKSPRYLVQIAHSSRSSGVVSGVQVAQPSFNRQAGKDVTVVVIAILDVEIGKPVYVASASHVGRVPLDEGVIAELAEAILPANDPHRTDAVP